MFKCYLIIFKEHNFKLEGKESKRKGTILTFLHIKKLKLVFQCSTLVLTFSL